MRVLLAVVDTGSLSAGSRRLNAPLPSVSRKVAQAGICNSPTPGASMSKLPGKSWQTSRRPNVAPPANIRRLRLPESPARSTVIVAGGGFTGIETAAEMPHRLRNALGKDADTRVVIVERNDAIGPDLGPGPRPIIEQALSELGVETRLGAAIVSIDQDGVTLASGERIDAATVIWTAGARANPITKEIDAEKDAFGRLHVDRNLKVIGHANVYATGDVAYAATDDVGNRTMMSCQHAQNLGRSAGHNVAADLVAANPIPYSQEKYVTCLDLGPWGAVYTEGWDRQVKLSGAEAKALKTKINTTWIYPPSAERAAALAAADPLRIVVA
jgi:NADH dehydrogenase